MIDSDWVYSLDNGDWSSCTDSECEIIERALEEDVEVIYVVTDNSNKTIVGAFGHPSILEEQLRQWVEDSFPNSNIDFYLYTVGKVDGIESCGFYNIYIGDDIHIQLSVEETLFNVFDWGY